MQLFTMKKKKKSSHNICIKNNNQVKTKQQHDRELSIWFLYNLKCFLFFLNQFSSYSKCRAESAFEQGKDEQ